MIGISILGATGSIGVSTLDVVSQHPDLYKVIALTANTDVESMFEKCLKFKPLLAVMADSKSAEKLLKKLHDTAPEIEIMAGTEGLKAAAEHADAGYLMAAIVGAAGLAPTLAGVRKGKRILLANKEALVVAGDLFMAEVKRYGAELLPIDSEHNAIFQCMPGNFEKGLNQVGVERILLTASGGPFRSWNAAQLTKATPEQACNHPNWDMGPKISVDSATMMNKGLEVIEARWLFDASVDQLQVVVHPQSVIHSMVQYVDGSVLAQLGNPDMRTPIAHAMAWPERHSSGVKSLNIFDIARLDFEEPDVQRFPCLQLAFDAANEGGIMPAVLNAANEIAVADFLDDGIGFTQIPQLIESVMSKIASGDSSSLDGLMAIDTEARRLSKQLIPTLKAV